MWLAANFVKLKKYDMIDLPESTWIQQKNQNQKNQKEKESVFSYLCGCGQRRRGSIVLLVPCPEVMVTQVTTTCH